MKMTTLNLSTNHGLNTTDRASYDRIPNNESDIDQYSTDQDSPNTDLESIELDYLSCDSEQDHNNSCYYLSQITEQDPCKWKKPEIILWLKHKNLYHLYELQPIMNCQTGKQLLRLNTTDFDYNDCIEKLFRELTKLQLKARKYIHNNVELTEYDIFEMKRRISVFTSKWDKILWIKHYHEINNKLPTKNIISFELGLSLPLSTIYLEEYYNNCEKYVNIDLNELFCNFNVYDDCILWWYLIITSLKTYASKSMWLIFARVALVAPHKISIELLQKYQKDLTRFDANELNKVTQQIVIGSRYPICTALQIAKWFIDRAKLDIARGIKSIFVHFSIFPFCSFFRFAVFSLIKTYFDIVSFRF